MAVPHQFVNRDGRRAERFEDPAAGFGLLVAAFVRLALNPAVLEYHQRSATPIFNWWLYTYGIATVCLFVGTKLLAPPRRIVILPADFLILWNHKLTSHLSVWPSWARTSFST